MIDEADELAPVEVPRPPPLTPVTDPLALKDVTLRDYTRNAGLFGMPTEPAEIERLVLQDLALADAFRRDEGPPREPTRETAEARQERHQRDAARIGQETGTTLLHDQPREWGPRLDLPPSIGLSERWRLAKGRLRRIMEGASAPIRHPDGSYDFRSMTATCGHPTGAFAFLEVWFSFDMRGVPETRRHNPFWGMSHRDASLKFTRLVENICDRSADVMGPWFVPK